MTPLEVLGFSTVITCMTLGAIFDSLLFLLSGLVLSAIMAGIYAQQIWGRTK